MKRVTQFIPSSLETCAPPVEGTYVCAPANHVARGRVRPVYASNGGRARMCPSAVHAMLLCSPLRCARPYERAPFRRTRPYECARPFATRALPPCVPSAVGTLLPYTLHYRSCHTRCVHPPFVPHETYTPPMCAHKSCSRPTPCVLLLYKFIKIIVHFTTWASKPSTTVRWMTIGCLDGDHLFLIHSHGHIHGCGCMHV
jgi:hypothetical protein